MPASPRQTLPRSVRVQSSADFDRIFKSGKRVSDGVMTLLAAPNLGGPSRLGIAASRRLGNAVCRNRIKRLVREAFRSIRHELPEGLDWVARPRPGCWPSADQVRSSLVRLSRRLAERLAPAEPR